MFRSSQESGTAEPDTASESRSETRPLTKTVGNVLEEARTILPGARILVGFQLIVVFNTRFHERLWTVKEQLHLGAATLVALATAMLITSAAYHRVAEPESVSRAFVVLATRLLSWSLVPLALAFSADFYLVASLVTANTAVSIVHTAAVLVVFCGRWFVLPARAAT